MPPPPQKKKHCQLVVTKQFCGRVLFLKHHQAGYRPPTLDSLGDKISQGSEISPRHARADSLDAPENAIWRYLQKLGVLPEGVAGMTRWRTIINLELQNAHPDAPHFCIFTMSLVLSTVKSGDFCIQNGLGRCFEFRLKGVSVQGTLI